jgi:Domain of unknown function (DUF6265)
MFRRIALVVLIALNACMLSNAGQKAGIERLEWMSGCWVLDDGKERTEETWMKPAGRSMLGMSRTVAGRETVFTEHIQIREADGQIAYIVALEMSAKPTVFKLIKNSNDEVVFENPAHDFPQRIIYRRESADALFARIEGAEKGVNKAMDFQYKRLKCD